MKNRIDLIKHFKELGFNYGAEVGVFEGRFSEIICKTIPGVKLLAIDDWVNKRVPAYEIAKQRLSPYNVKIIRKMSMEAIRDVNDDSLDFVYIDANHSYNWVKDDIREWTKKVKKGGIVSGDDYYITRKGNSGVIKAVNEYVTLHNLKLNVIDWCHDAENKDDRQPQWYFYKL